MGQTKAAGAAVWLSFLIASYASSMLTGEEKAVWIKVFAAPVFPYLGWIILGWILTWAAAELHMRRRLLGTTSLSGGQWGTVPGLSLLAPAVAGTDKIIQLRRQRVPGTGAEA